MNRSRIALFVGGLAALSVTTWALWPAATGPERLQGGWWDGRPAAHHPPSRVANAP